MYPSTWAALLAPAGQTALAEATARAPTVETFLTHLTALRKRYPADLAQAALDTALWRQKAARKFTRAATMYFTREALEQASGEAIARYRAARFAGLPRVGDLGCGIGGDTLALAAVAPVVGVERAPERLWLARANLAAYDLAERATWVQADLAAWPWATLSGAWCDPARRTAEGRRVFSVHDYAPPLADVVAWRTRAPALGVKISPGVQWAELAPYENAGEVEFISEHGELKECVLWFGPLKTTARRATLLPGPHTLTGDPALPAPLGPPLAYLYEPDPAILRAGLVTTLAQQLGAQLIDPEIAYLTSATRTPTPFARAFAIEFALPFNLKRLRAALRARNVGHLTVKKRGSPLEPEDVIRQLKPQGDAHRIVFLTHVQGAPYALVGEAV